MSSLKTHLKNIYVAPNSTSFSVYVSIQNKQERVYDILSMNDAIEQRSLLRMKRKRLANLSRAFNSLFHHKDYVDEIWLDIPNPTCLEYIAEYQVSNFGRVRNNRTRDLIKAYLKDRYWHVNLHIRGHKNHTPRIHRLVAMAFLPNTQNLPTVNHKNHDTSDNHVNNLEWASYETQNNHRRKVPTSQKRLISSRPIVGIHKTTLKILEFKTARYAAEYLVENALTNSKTPYSKLSACALGKRRSAFGYVWYYKDEKKDGERWADLTPELVHGVCGYKISTLGRVENRTGRITSGYSRGDEYTTVSIGSWQYLMHILVAKTFLPPPLPGQTQVNHKDRNKQNSTLQNLEWTTPSQNMLHRYGHDISTTETSILVV